MLHGQRWSPVIGNWLFLQQLVQVDYKENIKHHITGPLWGEFTGKQRIPLTKGQWYGVFPWHLFIRECVLVYVNVFQYSYTRIKRDNLTCQRNILNIISRCYGLYPVWTHCNIDILCEYLLIIMYVTLDIMYLKGLWQDDKMFSVNKPIYTFLPLRLSQYISINKCVFILLPGI